MPANDSLRDADMRKPLGRKSLTLAAEWSVIGIFSILAMTCVYHMQMVLVPLTLAIVVGMILGLLADRLGRLGVPGPVVAIGLSSIVGFLLFFIATSLAQPLARMAQEGPAYAQRLVDRLMPFMERLHWLRISPETLQAGSVSLEQIVQNSGGVLTLVSENVTPALTQALIFLAALLLFLHGRLKFRKAVILVFPGRRKRLKVIRILNAIERVLGHYFLSASLIYAAFGVLTGLIAYFGGLNMPVLWGIFAFATSFVPYVGIVVLTGAITVAGILTHETFLMGLAPAIALVATNAVTENLVFPAVMGRQLEINAFAVFVAILFWTWIWGAAGAMLALPLTLIAMTIYSELMDGRKPQPQLPS